MKPTKATPASTLGEQLTMASTQRPYAVLSSVRSTLSNCGNRHPVSPAIRGPDRTRLGAAAIAKAPPYRHRLDSDECPSASEMRPSVPAVRSRMRSGRTCAPTQPLGTMLQDHWVPKGAVPRRSTSRPLYHVRLSPAPCPLAGLGDGLTRSAPAGPTSLMRARHRRRPLSAKRHRRQQPKTRSAIQRYTSL
jgi:hypothetical protein